MLLAHADKFNEANGVTGVLLFTGNHFAQTLEGPPTVVDQLMARIGQDQRHKVLRTVDRHDVATRKFKTWSMAYSGASIFIAGIVSRPLTPHCTSRDVSRLVRLLAEFTTPLPPRPVT